MTEKIQEAYTKMPFHSAFLSRETNKSHLSQNSILFDTQPIIRFESFTVSVDLITKVASILNLWTLKLTSPAAAAAINNLPRFKGSAAYLSIYISERTIDINVIYPEYEALLSHCLSYDASLS